MRLLFGDYALDIDRRELTRGSELVSTTPQVFDSLAYLVQNRERVVSKDDLLDAVWQGRIVSESTLTSHINAVRKAVGDSGEEKRLIRTVARKGFRFVGDVREEQTSKDGGYTKTLLPMRDDEPMYAPALTPPDKPSIAVLPFTNMSGDPEHEYFADGMAEEIITALSHCSRLFVIARNSSFTYKGKAVDIRQIGRELGVRYVLEGSVRRGGNRLRIAGQLIDASSGAQLWADRFDGEMSDVFELQDRITENVVGAIEPKIQLAEIERLKHKPAANLDAYDLLLRAQQFEYEFTEASVLSALRCAQEALVIDPFYAPAMAMAAYCYGERRFQGWTREIEKETAEGLRLAKQALQLASDDANVLWMAALATWQLGSDIQHAKEFAYRSLEANPNSAIASAIVGWIEAYSGNSAKGMELLRRAQRLSPRDPRAWLTAARISIAHLGEGQFEEGASWAKKALAQNPRYTVAMRLLAAHLAQLGQSEPAREAIGEMFKVEPHLTLSALRSRLMFMHERVWKNLSNGLRIAGMPE